MPEPLDLSAMDLTDFERAMLQQQQAMLQQQKAIADGLRLLYREIRTIKEVRVASQPFRSYSFSLEEFHGFDWSSIGAEIYARDSDGVSIVQFRGQRYTRRSAANKFEPAVWFSRATGKDAAGENQYEKLITFKAIPQADPLPAKTKGAIAQ